MTWRRGKNYVRFTQSPLSERNAKTKTLRWSYSLSQSFVLIHYANISKTSIILNYILLLCSVLLCSFRSHTHSLAHTFIIWALGTHKWLRNESTKYYSLTEKCRCPDHTSYSKPCLSMYKYKIVKSLKTQFATIIYIQYTHPKHNNAL